MLPWKPRNKFHLHRSRATDYCVLLSTVQTYCGLYAKCPMFLSNYSQIWTFSTNILGSPQYKVSQKNHSVGATLIHADRRKDMPLFGTVRMHLQRDSWVEDMELNDGNMSFREFELSVCKKKEKLTGY